MPFVSDLFCVREYNIFEKSAFGTAFKIYFFISCFKVLRFPLKFSIVVTGSSILKLKYSNLVTPCVLVLMSLAALILFSCFLWHAVKKQNNSDSAFCSFLRNYVFVYDISRRYATYDCVARHFYLLRTSI